MDLDSEGNDNTDKSGTTLLDLGNFSREREFSSLSTLGLGEVPMASRQHLSRQSQKEEWEERAQ